MTTEYLGVKNVPTDIKTLLSVHANLTSQTQAEVLTKALIEYLQKHSAVKPKCNSGLTATPPTQLDRIESMLAELMEVRS